MGKQREIHTKLAGVTHKNEDGEKIQNLLKDISEFCYEGEPLSLEHDSENKHDKNAIKVFYGFDRIGYINRDLAEELAPLVDQQRVEAELCEITGGEDGKSFGCNILIRIVPEGETAQTDSREFVHLGRINMENTSSATERPKINSDSHKASYTPKEQETKENCFDKKPVKRRSGCLLQILAVPLILLVIGVIVSPKDKIDDNQGGDWSASQTADSSGKQEGNQTGYVSEPTTDPSLKDTVSKCITEFFDSESISALTARDQKIEVKISYAEASGDTPPDDWDTICGNFISAADALRENFSESEVKNIILQLVDSDGNIMLTVLNGKTSYTKYETFDYTDNPPTMSLEEFNAISVGMNFQEVADIVGSSGTRLSEVDLNLGDEYRTIIFQWDGEGSLGANANVTFQGGKVVSKAQFGLE